LINIEWFYLSKFYPIFKKIIFKLIFLIYANIFSINL
jgi:hypothetical protein